VAGLVGAVVADQDLGLAISSPRYFVENHLGGGRPSRPPPTQELKCSLGRRRIRLLRNEHPLQLDSGGCAWRRSRRRSR
jgi:hypothetical protein